MTVSMGFPVVKNLPCNTDNVGLIPAWGTKIPHLRGMHSTTREAREPQGRTHVPKPRPSATKSKQNKTK